MSSQTDNSESMDDTLRQRLKRWRGYARSSGLRFWLTLAGLAFLRSLLILPFAVQMWVGRVMGWLTWRFAAKPRRIVRRNIDAYFSDLSEAQRCELEKRSFMSLGMTITEVPYTWWTPHEKLLRRYSITGLEHIAAARAQGHGVLLLSFHFTTVESCGFVMCHQFPDLIVVYRPYRKNPLADEFTRRSRSRVVKELIDRQDLRRVARRLRQKEVVFFAGDLIVRRGKRCIELPFFGVPTLFHSGAIDLSAMTGARIVPYIPQRLPGGRYKIEILPAMEGIPSGDRVADQKRINDLLEEYIRRDPSQYLWTRDRLA
ncbi:MAG: hypothetical protein HKN06_04950 [Gammaproteobacteria bacterium]|nr:hypothetical protein [Gammaproteobacteria bacterium]